jgi:hypothetical protein
MWYYTSFRGHVWRRPCRWSLPLFLTGFLLLDPLRARGAEVWLAPIDPMVRSVVQPGVASDYFDVFSPDAPWPRSASAVSVFKIATPLALYGPEQQVRRIIEDLQRRHISLALEISALTRKGDCGQKVEGYGPPGEVVRAVERIRQLGGDLKYIAMDEPLWNGHAFNGANSCHTPISAIALDVAANVRAIKRVLPSVQIGDIEQVGRADPPDWVDQIMQWTKAYQDAAGEPLPFLHFDVVWAGPWRQQLTMLAPRIHAAGIKMGVIYNGDPEDQSDLAWTSHAEQRFSTIEADPAITPDQAIIQTWMLHPSHVLPETQPGTLTWLVNRYLASKTRLVLLRTGDRLQGELTDTAGHPLPAAQVTLSAQLLGAPGAPVLHTRSGQVPPKTATAVLALRINAECNCSGPADVAIGPVRYHDDRTGQIVERTFHPASARANTSTSARFLAEPGQPISQNTPKFPVTPDNSYTIQVPMSATLASAGSGYVALVFLDVQGKEVERVRLAFEPAEQPIGTVTTDAQGRFMLSPDAATLRTSINFRAEFAGDARHRLASATAR